MFDLLGCHATGFGEDGDERFVQVGEDIDRCVPGCDGTANQQEQGKRQHEQSMVEAVANDPVEHDVVGYLYGSMMLIQRICASSDAPCTTTRLASPSPWVTTTRLLSRLWYWTACGI